MSDDGLLYCFVELRHDSFTALEIPILGRSSLTAPLEIQTKSRYVESARPRLNVSHSDCYPVLHSTHGHARVWSISSPILIQVEFDCDPALDPDSTHNFEFDSTPSYFTRLLAGFDVERGRATGERRFLYIVAYLDRLRPSFSAPTKDNARQSRFRSALLAAEHAPPSPGRLRGAATSEVSAGRRALTALN
ncbi:hypothetical protein EVAR_75468_1 [Eumeta japonica]|uniref:Uncharacterized protein n=1 Tax=Eumeta variegata TaxID=151549 RepID=A0A4C1TK01_EUMVA|nr:hypothetical protein EVAR_75468_1 [Eumeta japonica]